MCLEERPCLEPNAGGIDIGAREIFVAVPPDRDEHPVRVFQTFTEDLHAMAQWLKACGVTTEFRGKQIERVRCTRRFRSSPNRRPDRFNQEATRS
jgi:hypothetical protein